MEKRVIENGIAVTLSQEVIKNAATELMISILNTLTSPTFLKDNQQF
ncbi:hypothetical protein SAMN05444673_4402 [Bacillus sp. OV166]|nr:hypothetical protein [Bacillus sp. OV166]SMQ81602.1 hypothetical protein SAMN05444673_4402 [Bacillus sp. OV166]